MGISDLLNGFVYQAMTVALSIVLLMAILSVIRAWWRAGAQVTVTVIGAIVLAAVVIWGVVNFLYLKDLVERETDQIDEDNRGTLLPPEVG